MKTLIFCTLMCFASMSWAINCDLHEFKWECDLSVKTTYSASHPHIVYCGDSYVYLNNRAKRVFDNYQRASVNMVLKVDGQYLDSPCFY